MALDCDPEGLLIEDEESSPTESGPWRDNEMVFDTTALLDEICVCPAP